MHAIPLILMLTMVSCVQTRSESVPPAPAPKAADNLWFDEIGQRWWVLGKASVPWADAKAACKGSYGLPTTDELRLAWTRGLCSEDEDEEEGDEVDTVCPTVWSVSVTRTQALMFNLVDGQATAESKTEGRALTYCIQGA